MKSKSLKSNSKTWITEQIEDGWIQRRLEERSFVSFGVMDVNRLLNCKGVDTTKCRSGNDDLLFILE